MEKEKKIRIPLWIMPSTNLRVKQAVERHDANHFLRHGRHSKRVRVSPAARHV